MRLEIKVGRGEGQLYVWVCVRFKIIKWDIINLWNYNVKYLYQIHNPNVVALTIQIINFVIFGLWYQCQLIQLQFFFLQIFHYAWDLSFSKFKFIDYFNICSLISNLRVIYYKVNLWLWVWLVANTSWIMIKKCIPQKYFHETIVFVMSSICIILHFMNTLWIKIEYVCICICTE